MTNGREARARALSVARFTSVGALARRLGASGLPVIVGSRDAAKARDAAAVSLRETRTSGIEGRSNRDARREPARVIVTVPFASQGGGRSRTS
jgi:predicted dinucleotide-binding enzyme